MVVVRATTARAVSPCAVAFAAACPAIALTEPVAAVASVSVLAFAVPEAVPAAEVLVAAPRAAAVPAAPTAAAFAVAFAGLVVAACTSVDPGTGPGGQGGCPVLVWLVLRAILVLIYHTSSLDK